MDYGLKGAVAYVGQDEAEPRRELAGKPVRHLAAVPDLYPHGLAMLERGWNVYVEDFMLRYATKSQREACIRYGVLLGDLKHAGCVIRRVPAEDWKRALGLVTKRKKTYAQRKAAALALARRCWPDFPFKRSDQAEAALIAEYGWRQR